METEKRNQIILISTIIFLLLSVILISIMLSYSAKNNGAKIKIAFKQIYSSDYELHYLGDSYFFGTYDNKINVIINTEGKEIYKSEFDIPYTNIYKTENGNYLICNLENNTLISYLFDGNTLKYLYRIENIENIKPIFYKEEYLIGFVSLKEENFILYEGLSGNAITIDFALVGDQFQNNVYINLTKNYLVIKDKSGYMGIIDLKGNLVIDCQYKNIIGTENNSFIALNKKNKYGILSLDGKTELEFNYNAIASIFGYYLIVNNKNKMALYTSDLQNTSGFVMEYNTIIPYDIRSKTNSIDLIKNENKVFVINNKLENRNKIEYNSHYLYVLENNQVIDKIIQEDFFISNYLIYKKDMNYYIYDNKNTFFTLPIEEKIKKIDSIGDLLQITYEDKNNENKIMYFNLLTNTLSNISEEYVINTYSSYYGILDNNKKIFILTDLTGKEINRISGKKIIVNNEFLIVDCAIYQIINKD